MSAPWSTALLATLALLACERKSASDGPSPGPSASAEVLSPFAAAEALRAPAPVVDAAPAPWRTYCHMPLGVCGEYTGLTAEEFQDAKEKCLGVQAVFDTTPCSQVDLLGTCEHWAAAEGVTDKAKMVLSKSVALKSVEDARAFCDQGKFVEASKSPPQVDARAPGDGGRARGP